ncbi:family 2 encapsulin nanocompartment cargo protein terpene cyclase [Streptomyces sp. B6B3]|uniref:family 2 encapsulin nanocompartment cargo protein terpene cyclase n=1 Tax=Streptomyces sp. B6B3 TaxID=3153570 RepID=UPI00325F3BFC
MHPFSVPPAPPPTPPPAPPPSLPLSGPTGLGTAAARLRPLAEPSPATEPATEPEPERDAPAVRVPELYCPDAVRDDPALAADVNDRLVAWAEEIGIYEGRIDRLRSHDFGRLMMLVHPDCDDPARLEAAARCALSEWAVDDHWVDEGEHADPELIGNRLALAHAVVDPVRMPARYVHQFEQVVEQEPVLRAFRSSLNYLARYASWTQVARLRHELAVMFVGYGQEAQWRTSGRTPAVWEYLLHRYENAFFPCMALVDPIGGYEVPAEEYADPRVRRTYLIAGTASVLLNDLYSMGKEDPTDTNLPNLIVAEEHCSLQEAVDRTAEIHDDMMHAFEAEAAALSAAGSPQLRRFLGGVWAWMGGGKEWHSSSHRYHAV